MRVNRHDDAVAVALRAARNRDLFVILRFQELVERRLVVVDGGVDRQRTTRRSGLGVHAVTADGSIGFASTDDLSPGGVRALIELAGGQAHAARAVDAARAPSVFQVGSSARVRLEPSDGATVTVSFGEQIAAMMACQEAVSDIRLGEDRTLRSALFAADEEWRIVRSDGTDVSFATPRATLRHELSVRTDGRLVRASASVSGTASASLLAEGVGGTLVQRARRAAADARLAAAAPAIESGRYRVVLRHGLAKGLAHEAIGHLCESDVDASVLVRRGRLRIGERLARPSVSVIDGPLLGDYAQQPYSANGLPRETVTLVDHGVLRAGLGDLFSSARAGVPMTGACRAASFRDRPTPRMTNIRIVVDDALPLDLGPDTAEPEEIAAALDRLGLLPSDQRTVYLTGYRGGIAHARRGDFAFGAEAAFDLSAGGQAYGPASFTGLAERALAAIVAGVGPLCTDAQGTCGKDGSSVSSSGGSHALLVIDADPDLVVSAAR
jgi:TldD protein